MEEMLAAGKRVLLLSGVNYGAHMEPLIFKRWAFSTAFDYVMQCAMCNSTWRCFDGG